jgi:dTDP-glucose 4,6-dehydratase
MLLKKLAGRLNVHESELTGLIRYVADRKGHDRRYAIDPSKIEKQTGWKPETGFEEGITKTIDWYLSNKQWMERVLSGEYMKYYNQQYGERLKH